MIGPGADRVAAKAAYARSLYEITQAVLEGALETECRCGAGTDAPCVFKKPPSSNEKFFRMHNYRIKRAADRLVSWAAREKR